MVDILNEAQTAPGRITWLWLIPLALTAFVYLGACSRAVIDYDEGHYSQVAKQMVERNDWITPYDNGVRFLEKPPLMYWATAASFRAFGINEFALRLPTALAMIALTLTVMLMARHASGATAAAITGLCTSLSVGAYLFTREALHDVWLVLFLTLALHAFLKWRQDPQHSLRHSLLFYASTAGALMTKSLVGLAFPAGIIVVFFLLKRERPKLRSLHLLPGLSLFLLLTIPWHLIVALRNQGFFWSFFVNEQFLRFLGRHDPPIVWSIPLLLFWALIPLWFFPWTAFLPAAVKASRRPRSNGEALLMRLCLAWLIVVLGFYSISGRLEHYAFLILPALSLAVGVALSRTGESPSIKWGFRGLAGFGLLVLAAGVGTAIWLAGTGFSIKENSGARTSVVSETDFSILADMPRNLMQNLIPPAIATICILAVAFGAALWLEHRRRRMGAVFTLAAGMFVICGMIQWSLIICEDLISSKKFASLLALEARSGDRLVVFGDFESANSLTFYQPLHMEICGGVAYSLIPGMKYPDAPRIILSREEFQNLWKGTKRVYALIPGTRLGDLNPAGAEILRVSDRVLVRNRS